LNFVQWVFLESPMWARVGCISWRQFWWNALHAWYDRTVKGPVCGWYVLLPLYSYILL